MLNNMRLRSCGVPYQEGHTLSDVKLYPMTDSFIIPFSIQLRCNACPRQVSLNFGAESTICKRLAAVHRCLFHTSIRMLTYASGPPGISMTLLALKWRPTFIVNMALSART